jgi:hypothetical protein
MAELTWYPGLHLSDTDSIVICHAAALSPRVYAKQPHYQVW